jgi:HK97 family phage major capsid protein/HK97 family phage prohead protease
MGTKKSPPPPGASQLRQLVVRAEGAMIIDKEARTLRFPFSSEVPCDMWYGTEILSHAPGAMRSGERQGSLPLLFNHNRNDLLGVVMTLELGTDRRGYCEVRFGRDERGEWALGQVDDKILVNASFMYRVFKFEEDVENDLYTATDWEPYEISLVTVPADPTVGIGRSLDENALRAAIQAQQPQPAPAETMEQQHMFKQRHSPRVLRNQVDDGATGGGAGGVATAAPVDQIALRSQGAEEERKRVAEIDSMCRQHGVPDDVRTGLIQKGASLSEARGAVLDLTLARSAAPVANMGDGYAPDMSQKEKGKYSMLRAINAALKGDWKAAGFELEVSNDIGKRMGRSTTGFYMPTNIPFAERAQYAAGAQATGGAMVATNLLAGSFIDILRNRARVFQLGATVLSGLTGNVDIPRQNGASSTFWVTEGGNLTESEATFDKVSLSLKSIGTYSAITRQMLLQSTPDIEMLARADLIAQIALGIDLAALSGTGTGGMPLGIANMAGIGSVVGGTNGAQLTLDHLIDLETSVANANADVDTMSYLANAKSVGWLKKLKSTTGQYLWTNSPGGQRSGTPGEVNGYPVARSNQARSTLTKGTSAGVCSEIFFGNWSELLIGEWGVLEITPNPYDTALFKQGGVLLRAMQSLDIGARHAASFSTISDALTA